MIKINLISTTDKENLKWEKINKVVVSYALKAIIIEAVFVVSISCAMAYLYYMKEQVNAELVMAENTKETLEIKQIEESLKTYEKNLKVVSGIHQGHIRWSEVMDSFSDLVTQGIKINSIRFRFYEQEEKGKNRENKKVKIDMDRFIVTADGDAKKREDLMAFEKKLTDPAVIFKMMETGDPSYNKYVNSENIRFSFNFLVSRADLVRLAENKD